MRTHVWIAALVVVLGLALRSDAQVGLVASTGSSTQSTPSFFSPLSLPSFLSGPSHLSSFFPSMPSISNPNAIVATAPVPLNSNGTPGAAYFQQFNLQYAPRATPRSSFFSWWR